VRILDWEYAGMTDPYFDLANLAANHGFDADAETALVHHYFGVVAETRLATLRLMKLVSELREAMWGVLQQAVSDLDVDFTAYATEHADRFGEILAGLALDDLLASAAAMARSEA
jgi:thiamine kinase-like enzyme